jgi:hypothetical protein
LGLPELDRAKAGFIPGQAGSAGRSDDDFVRKNPGARSPDAAKRNPGRAGGWTYTQTRFAPRLNRLLRQTGTKRSWPSCYRLVLVAAKAVVELLKMDYLLTFAEAEVVEALSNGIRTCRRH